MGDMPSVAANNEEAVEAWNGVLFERFVQYRRIVTEGLGAHGEVALGLHPPQPGERKAPPPDPRRPHRRQRRPRRRRVKARRS